MTMISFTDITLTQFRNYDFQKFVFEKKIVGIYGENGTGKTNLLDAVYYLCFTKSYFNRPDGKSVRQGNEGFRIHANLCDNTQISCVLRETGKKEFVVDNEPYKKFSEHVGKYPCVMIAPDDVQLILGGSEERRKYADAILSQINAAYMETLIRYNKVLQQRNSLLKNNDDAQYDESLLDIFDKQLTEEGQKIYHWRKDFFEEIIPQIIHRYNVIAGKDDNVKIEYISQLTSGISFEDLLRQQRSKDFILQRSTAGVHKDDITFLMDEYAFKNIASQGQRKSLLFALRLAEYIFLKDKLGKTPFLLLDDVFEKLDAKRMDNLLQFICTQPDAQIFITDTHEHRLKEAFVNFGAEYQLIGLQ